MYLFWWVVISTCYSFASSFGNDQQLSAILLPIKSQGASTVFWIVLFKAVIVASVVDFLALSRIFLTIFIT